jgi:hypothetical protein
MVDYCVSPPVIPPAIGDVGLLGLRFFLWRSAEKISGGKLQAVRTHDSYEHVAILIIGDVSHSILTERVADLTIDAPVFPGYELPCADERIGYPHKVLSLGRRVRSRGTEIDVRFVGLERRSHRAAAVSAKAPGIRLTTGA